MSSLKRGKLPSCVREGHRIVGYLSYTDTGAVLCDGDACIIAGTEESLGKHLEEGLDRTVKNVPYRTKKLRFSEVIDGLKHGVIYAFDKEAYFKLIPLAEVNGMDWFPEKHWDFSASEGERCYFVLQAAG